MACLVAVCPYMPPLLAAPGSVIWNRAPFTRHNVSIFGRTIFFCVTDNISAQLSVIPYAEDEIFPSGVHINQHPGGEDFGLAEWIKRDAPIVNEDVVSSLHRLYRELN